MFINLKDDLLADRNRPKPKEEEETSEKKSDQKESDEAGVKDSTQSKTKASKNKTKNTVKEEAPLLCNIPEHHKLEDINHQLKEQISSLRNFIKSNQQQENELMEKRAEFEALDLAINDRKQQLLKLEMAKNRRLNRNVDKSFFDSQETLIEVLRIVFLSN